MCVFYFFGLSALICRSTEDVDAATRLAIAWSEGERHDRFCVQVTQERRKENGFTSLLFHVCFHHFTSASGRFLSFSSSVSNFRLTTSVGTKNSSRSTFSAAHFSSLSLCGRSSSMSVLFRFCLVLCRTVWFTNLVYIRGEKNVATQVARCTASMAMIDSCWTLLRSVLDYLSTWKFATRNYALCALEGALSSCGGHIAPPQWLVTEACGRGGSNQAASLLLRYGCVSDVATLLTKSALDVDNTDIAYASADGVLQKISETGVDVHRKSILMNALRTRIGTASSH